MRVNSQYTLDTCIVSVLEDLHALLRVNSRMGRKPITNYVITNRFNEASGACNFLFKWQLLQHNNDQKATMGESNTLGCYSKLFFSSCCLEVLSTSFNSSLFARRWENAEWSANKSACPHDTCPVFSSGNPFLITCKWLQIINACQMLDLSMFLSFAASHWCSS